MDAEEQALVRSSLRHVLETTDADGVNAALIAEGWAELVESEPQAAITALAEEAGALQHRAPVADVAMLWSLGRGDIEHTAVVLPNLEHTLRPPATEAGDALTLCGIVWAGERPAEHLVSGTATGVVIVPAAMVELDPIGGFDPELGLRCATGHVTSTSIEAWGDADTWATAIAAGRRALASQMLGAATQMLHDTAVYVEQRHQYGRSIGSFQTVKHRLADVHVASTSARAAVAASWADGSSVSAAAAKALAGRAQRLASEHCQQVQGGIAFTVEHGFHDRVRRGHLLDATLGNSDDLTREVGRQLIDTGEVPRVPVLNLG